MYAYIYLNLLNILSDPIIRRHLIFGSFLSYLNRSNLTSNITVESRRGFLTTASKAR